MEKRTYSTDREIKALKPAVEKGKSYDVKDTKAPNLFIRVRPADSDGRFRRTFVLMTRLPGAKNTARFLLGDYGDITLEEARDRAAEWRKKIRDGINPRQEAEEAKKAEEEAKRKAEEETKKAEEEASEKEKLRFGVVIEEYITSLKNQSKNRRSGPAEREIRNELIPVWKDKFITEITKSDVTKLVKAISKDRLYHAHNVYGHARTFFNWVVEQGDYGIETSPCYGIKPSKVIGEKKPRQRILNNSELTALWEASALMASPTRLAEGEEKGVPAGYPYGFIFRLLAVTGQRKSEVAEARWREFHPELVRLLRSRKAQSLSIDWGKVENELKVWTIPAERFKSDATHTVPLSDDALAILEALPIFDGGDYLFSTTGGRKPVGNFGKAKERLDATILEILRGKAAEHGDDPTVVELPNFVLHDIRRTVRTGLSTLRISTEVAEVVIGHGKQGLERIYNLHAYDDEKREALNLWAARLRSIVSPPPTNVITLRGAQNA